MADCTAYDYPALPYASSEGLRGHKTKQSLLPLDGGGYAGLATCCLVAVGEGEVGVASFVVPRRAPPLKTC